MPIIILCTGTIAWMYSTDNPFGYDESDYMFATGRGFIANYLDAVTIPFSSFLEAGLNLGRDKSKRTELSALIRTSGDIPFYRHYHGPMYIYWLHLVQDMGFRSERDLRIGSLTLLGLTAIVLLAGGLRWIRSLPALGLTVGLLFVSEINILADATLTPHGMYAITCTAALVLLAIFLQTSQRKYWYWSVVALALSFASIEYASMLFVTFVVCAIVFRKQIFAQERWLAFTLRSFILFLAITCLIWLGGIIRLTILKNYIFFAYFTLFRGGEYGGSFTHAWVAHFIDYTVPCVIGFAALIYWTARISRERYLSPLLVYPLLILVTSLRNTSTSPTYISSIFPPLFLLAGIAFDRMLRERSVVIQYAAATAILIVGVFLLSPRENQARADEGAIDQRAILAYVTSPEANASTFVVPRLYQPTLHYYFPSKNMLSYAEDFDSPGAVRSLMSAPGDYRLLSTDRKSASLIPTFGNEVIRTDTLVAKDSNSVLFTQVRVP